MYEQPDRFYNTREYVETVRPKLQRSRPHVQVSLNGSSVNVFQNTGNKVSKKTVLCGSQQILLSGKVRLQAFGVRASEDGGGAPRSMAFQVHVF